MKRLWRHCDFSNFLMLAATRRLTSLSRTISTAIPKTMKAVLVSISMRGFPERLLQPSLPGRLVSLPTFVKLCLLTSRSRSLAVPRRTSCVTSPSRSPRTMRYSSKSSGRAPTTLTTVRLAVTYTHSNARPPFGAVQGPPAIHHGPGRGRHDCLRAPQILRFARQARSRPAGLVACRIGFCGIRYCPSLEDCPAPQECQARGRG